MSEAISCPLCEGSSSEPVIRDSGFTGRQCATCGVIFIAPRPSQDEMTALYESGEAHLAPEFFLANSQSIAGRIAAWHSVRTIRRYIDGGSLLEIGPGNGAFLAEACRKGFDGHGVELNPHQAEFIRTKRRLPCVTSLEAAAAVRPGGFNVVYHRDVISHFYDPMDELRQIRALIASGGYHVFETGNLGDVDHRHFANIRSFQYPDHLFFYSERGLLEVLRRTGFEHVHTYRYSLHPEQVFRRVVWRARDLVARDASTGTSDGVQGAVKGSAGALGQAARDALDLAYYAIRQTAGRVRIKHDEPQTLIVVARKAG